MLESAGPSYSSNSKGDEKEINEHYNEINMEEADIDLEYMTVLSNAEQFGFGHYDSPEEEMEEDPSYKIFCENIKEDGDGQSFSVEIPISSGISFIIRYDEMEEESSKNVDRRINFMSYARRVNAKVPENSGGFLRKAKTAMPKTVKKSLKHRAEGSKNNAQDVPSEERKSLVDKNRVKKAGEVSVPYNAQDVPSEERKRLVDKNRVKKAGEVSVPYKSSVKASKRMNLDTFDESFVQFLDDVDKPDNNMELSDESDQTSIRGKNDGSCSDLEILASDNIPFYEGDYTPFVPSKCYQSLPDEESWDGIRTSSRSQFREKLMDLLKIPYDQKEFENLWREVTFRKPVQGVKELRHGRMKQYPTKTDGKSYLDWYKELRMKIDEFRQDRQKILYLLRGFFFWLENAAHEDTFQPWLDSLFLNALR